MSTYLKNNWHWVQLIVIISGFAILWGQMGERQNTVSKDIIEIKSEMKEVSCMVNKLYYSHFPIIPSNSSNGD
jgi:hypothetical protein